MANIAHAFLGLTGQEIDWLEIPWEGEAPAIDQVRLEGPAVSTEHIAYLKESRGVAPGDVKSVEVKDGVLHIEVVPSTNKAVWTLAVGDKKIGQSEFEVKTRTMDDKFAKVVEGRLMYRLYSPENATTPRPMILFLHGGGNGGYEDGEGARDNEKQLTADFGPVNFAEDYPDLYVLAPMCVEERRDFSKVNMNNKFENSDFSKDPRYGWSRYYLGLVCDLIRRMIDEGKVDPKRIYVTGMSMGGAGTVRAMSVGSDLFAAAVPVCPSMTPETFTILKSIRRPIWVTSAYIDHTLYRHKYLVDAVMNMRDNGNDNAHLTLFSPEDLEKYDVSITPSLMQAENYGKLFRQNHWSWVPTYKNEYGIMSWLLNQTKDD
ncbi:MAG: prolyl oligopeptidase family serine peptidase [Oscillospiraceae bacterium]|nr:prolyl oligopeptidase family serine peptidase [Oscillospiraceae bacterium]MBQ5343147.1 prolyl oligopeptidase family serine peptidase [Oscillospiraceae bacterium]